MLFADDAKCSSVVHTPDNCLALQRDLDCLYDGTTLWGLKWEVLRISRKRSSSLLNIVVSPYTLDDFPNIRLVTLLDFLLAALEVLPVLF